MSESLPPFPKEDRAAPWPSLIPTQNDRRYMPKAAHQQNKTTHLGAQVSQDLLPQVLPIGQQAQTDAQPRIDQRQLFAQDLRAAMTRGAFLGLLLSGLLSTFVFQWAFWLQNWGWGIVPLLLLVLFVRFFGFGSGTFSWCILAALGGLVLMCIQLIRGQAALLFVLLISLAFCIAVKVIVEWLYVPRTP